MQQLTRRLDSIEHTPAQEAFDELEKVRRVVVAGQTVAVWPCGCLPAGLLQPHNYIAAT